MPGTLTSDQNLSILDPSLPSLSNPDKADAVGGSHHASSSEDQTQPLPNMSPMAAFEGGLEGQRENKDDVGSEIPGSPSPIQRAPDGVQRMAEGALDRTSSLEDQGLESHMQALRLAAEEEVEKSVLGVTEIHMDAPIHTVISVSSQEVAVGTRMSQEPCSNYKVSVLSLPPSPTEPIQVDPTILAEAVVQCSGQLGTWLPSQAFAVIASGGWRMLLLGSALTDPNRATIKKRTLVQQRCSLELSPWESDKGFQVLGQVSASTSLPCIVCSSRGQVVAAGDRGEAHVWQVCSLSRTISSYHPLPPAAYKSYAFSDIVELRLGGESQQTLVGLSSLSSVAVWDLQSLQLLVTMHEPDHHIWTIQPVSLPLSSLEKHEVRHEANPLLLAALTSQCPEGQEPLHTAPSFVSIMLLDEGDMVSDVSLPVEGATSLAVQGQLAAVITSDHCLVLLDLDQGAFKDGLSLPATRQPQMVNFVGGSDDEPGQAGDLQVVVWNPSGLLVCCRWGQGEAPMI